MFSKCILATAILMALPAATAWAGQADPEEALSDVEFSEEDVDEVIQVRGAQHSMSEALARKRDSIQLVDSIVAEDIGKLPNNNVVEALQHVPGVQVGTRSAGELSSLSIRGLGQVVTTINGRRVFSTAGRSFALQDIPATMVAGMDVYKTASADMVEGGVGGVIDIQTRRPLDFEGSQFSITGKATYSDQSEKTDPNISVLLSNRWETSVGDVGMLVNASYIKTNYRDQVIWAGALLPYDDAGGRIESTPGEELSITDDSYSLVRESIGAVDDMGDRERPSLNLSFEWAPNASSSYYFDAFYTGYRETGHNEFLYLGTDSQPLLSPYSYVPGTNVVSRAHYGNPYVMTSSTNIEGQTDGYQYVLGGNWNLTPNLDLTSEVDYQLSKYKSTSQILDVEHSVDEMIVHFNDNGSRRPAVEIIGDGLTTFSGISNGPYFDRRHESRGEAVSWRADFDYFRPLGFVENWEFGTRYELRDATSNHADRNSCLDCGSINVGDIDGLMTMTPGNFFNGNGGYPAQWATPSAQFMRDNLTFMRQTFGGYSDEPEYDPTEFFDIEEESVALYGQANILTTLGQRVLDGTFGIRVVHTQATLTGYEIVEDAAPVLREYESDSTEILPNLTLRYQLTDDFQFRFNASRTVTRPGFGDLNPTLTLRPPIPGQIDTGRGDGGNVDLQPIKANNFDFGAEYYFGESSALYATLFYRDIANWIVPSTENEVYDGQVYTVTRPTNAGSGEMQGVELGVQYFPQFVPDWMQGIGLQAGYTYIDAHIDDEDGVEQPMQGVSKNSLSMVLVYERGPFSARLSHTYREAHLAGYNRVGNMPEEIITDDLNFTDFSASYEITDRFIVTFDATNILGEKFYDYFGDPDLFNRDVRQYSKTYAVGFRYSI